MPTNESGRTELTMRELCAKATPGPWKALYMGSSDWGIHQVAPDRAMVHYAGEVGRDAADANCHLSARCSPTVMLAILEGLEEINRDAWSDDKTRMRVIARTSDDLLRLLNTPGA